MVGLISSTTSAGVMGPTPPEKSSEPENSIGRFPVYRDDTREPHLGQDASVDSRDRDVGGAARWPDRRADFPLSVTALVGQELQIRCTGPRHDRIWELAPSSGYQVASLRLYAPGVLAEIACQEGTWSVHKRQRRGWELWVEAADGRSVAWYSGNHWCPGGTIILADGARLDLRRSVALRWTLRAEETREPIMEISRHRRGAQRVTIRSFPPEIYSDAPIVILTACAVIMLIATVDAVGGAAGGGGGG